MIGDLVHLSALDEKRFGVVVAIATDVTMEAVNPILEFCRHRAVRLLIVRCSAQNVNAAQELESNGCLLMDTLVESAGKSSRVAANSGGSSGTVRAFTNKDVHGIIEVARCVFANYRSHYHADPRLRNEDCDEVYVSWAERSCASREVADEVLVSERDGRIVGFVTLKVSKAGEGAIQLGGVLPEAQGAGLYREFIINGARWFETRQVQVTKVSSQVTNIAVQKVWARLGLEPRNAYYTFHRWFDDVDS
jgi:ribosomal protein S18 acetylase RimI-like enzyme